MFHPSILVSSKYVVIFKTGTATSEDALSRGWIRFEMFVPRVVASMGSYRAVFETSLKDLNSLAGMQFSASIQLAIHPDAYVPDEDPLCPYRGSTSSPERTDIIRSACAKLLQVAREYEDERTFVKKQLSIRKRMAVFRQELTKSSQFCENRD